MYALGTSPEPLGSLRPVNSPPSTIDGQNLRRRLRQPAPPVLALPPAPKRATGGAQPRPPGSARA
eukprot:9817813-Alexandrium_andersonii.AAC.1